MKCCVVAGSGDLGSWYVTEVVSTRRNARKPQNLHVEVTRWCTVELVGPRSHASTPNMRRDGVTNDSKKPTNAPDFIRITLKQLKIAGLTSWRRKPDTDEPEAHKLCGRGRQVSRVIQFKNKK